MYRKENYSGFAGYIDFLVIDILLAVLSLVMALVCKHLGKIPSSEMWNFEKISVYLSLFEILSISCFGTFKDIRQRGYYREMVTTIKQTTVVVAGLILMLYLTNSTNILPRSVYVTMWVFMILLTYLVHIAWKAMLRSDMVQRMQKKNTLIIITTKEKSHDVVLNLYSNKERRFKIVGIIIMDADMVGETICDIPVVARKENITDYLCRNWVDEVFVTLGSELYHTEQMIEEKCILMGISVHKTIAKSVLRSGAIQQIENIADFTVVTSTIHKSNRMERVIKRCVDIVGGIVGMALTGILVVVLTPFIFVQSPGPIFFKQWRVGRNGKKFKLYKFRSMYMDAEERKKELMAQNMVNDGLMFKMENDPRIIGGRHGRGIGNFIRKTSLDEFPQFYNVLKGEMSLVGTRPPTVDEWEKYDLHHRARLAIKPGITGLWQVSGRSNIKDFEEVVKLDTEYIMKWNLGMDVKILTKTVAEIFGKHGAI